MLDFVGEAELFESDGDLDAVGRGVCVERDVRSLSHVWWCLIDIGIWR